MCELEEVNAVQKVNPTASKILKRNSQNKSGRGRENRKIKDIQIKKRYPKKKRRELLMKELKEFAKKRRGRSIEDHISLNGLLNSLMAGMSE